MNNWLPIENIPENTRVLLNLNNYVYIGECLSKYTRKFIYDHRPVMIYTYPENSGPNGWQNLPEGV